MSRESNSSGGGVSFLGLLGIVFIVLKLTHVINWSWWVVLLPLYGGLVLFVIGFFIYLLVKSILRRKK